MIHIQKYNELVEYKEGDILDPTMDIEEFKKKFEKKIRKDDIIKLDAMLYKFPTQTDVWKIYEIKEVLDDYGRRTKVVCYIKGVTPNHARLRASLIFNDIEIFTTGFYRSDSISEDEINKRISNELDNIKKIENEINQLKNPL